MAGSCRLDERGCRQRQVPSTANARRNNPGEPARPGIIKPIPGSWNLIFLAVALIVWLAGGTALQTTAAEPGGALLTPTPYAPGDKLLPTYQMIHPAGTSLDLGGRPVDMAMSPDGRRVYVKNAGGLNVVNTADWRAVQYLKYPGGGATLHGIAVSRDGLHVYVTGARDELYDYQASPTGTVALGRTIALPAGTDPCGLALSGDGTKGYVCLGRSNTLAVVDLVTGTLLSQIIVGIAPWDVVLAPDETTAYVSNWGGRHPGHGDLSDLSAGTRVVVDDRGIGASGSVSFVDLAQRRETAQVATGLHPSDLELSREGRSLFVANANSDFLSVIDTQSQRVRESVLLRPTDSLSASAPDGLALSRDGKELYVALAGFNAVAVVELAADPVSASVVRGFLPTSWYPGSVLVDSGFLYVADVKGWGSLPGNLFNVLGRAEKVPLPSASILADATAAVRRVSRFNEIQEALAPARKGQTPRPVPVHAGEPSVFQHVLYIIKENRAYDPLLGDLPQGNGRASLCTTPRQVTPNHHALATQYVLLDNYYCNGVLSADGHSWSVEANVTDHIEKSFGGWARSYQLGTDALTYSSTGFIWNNALSHGRSFRNYGELEYSFPAPQSSWLQIYADYTNHTGRIRFRHDSGVTALLPYSSTNVPGWNLAIPDQVRADGFIKDLRTAEYGSGSWENQHILYLPGDHTMGLTPGFPSPRAMTADNDLALGRVVEAVTRSRFGGSTCIFVIEDDPQGGPDHVDGHRSICLVISPYTKRRETVSHFYNQSGVVHTIEQILGLPPMNQMDALAPLLSECFTNTPDYTPYTALPTEVPLDEMNPGTTGRLRNAQELYWANRSLKLNFSKPDLASEDELNRILWHSLKGGTRYPREFAGAHGRGLKQLGLISVSVPKDDDDQ